MAWPTPYRERVVRPGVNGRDRVAEWLMSPGLGADVNLGLGAGFQFPAGMTPAAYLTGQINRFAGVRTPAAFPVPTDNTLDPTVAFWAVTLYNESVTSAAAAGTANSSDVLAAAASLLGAPMTFVSANLPAVAAMITGYADMLKLPPAVGSGPSPLMIGVVVGVAILVVVMMKKGKRKR